MNLMTCKYCKITIEKPRRKFCSHKCACSYRKGTLKRRGPNTGKSSEPNYKRDSQRRRRGWTPEQIEIGMASTKDRFAPARKLGYRSMYEFHIFEAATESGQTLEYEPIKLRYELLGHYVPDFVLPNGIIVEAKGQLDSRSRAKMLAVKKHNPELDIRFVFMDSRKKLRKGSSTTYADWCTKYGFKFADGMIPEEWFTEMEQE
jgi:hypothetical protein